MKFIKKNNKYILIIESGVSMYKCKYCGRYLKDNYSNCPGCGSNNFERTYGSGVQKITQVPDGGYKIGLDRHQKSSTNSYLFAIIVFIILIFKEICFPYIDTLLDDSDSYAIVLCFIAVFGLLGVIIGSKRKNKRINKLRYHGLLIKNLNYTVKKISYNEKKDLIYYVEVIYETEQGSKIPIVGEFINEERLKSGKGTMDLLIDPDDITNYYMDFEIY